MVYGDCLHESAGKAVCPSADWDAKRAVFFPGCALKDASPQLCDAVYQWLVERGLCVDRSQACCSLPLSYKGEVVRFKKALGALLARFTGNAGYSAVITACPNCYYALKDAVARLGYEGDLKIVALPELLANCGLRISTEEYGGLVFAIHDSCPDKREQIYATAMRELAENLDMIELAHSKTNPMCCGTGREYYGRPFDEQIEQANQRMAEAEGATDGVIAGCATCVYALSHTNASVPTYHYLEMLFGTPFGK